MTSRPEDTAGVAWSDLLRVARDRLATAPLADASFAVAEVEARWIVEAVSGLDAAGLHAATAEPDQRVWDRVAELLERRLAGEPLQYLLGEWSFRGHDLMVDPRVLIPRPETEITAQIAIDEARRLGERHGRPDPWAGVTGGGPGDFLVVDLGTGSGAIAIALATELPDAVVWATDVSGDALAVARANVAGAGSAAVRVRLAAGDWYDALPRQLAGRIRVVVSNPPYVAEAEVADLAAQVADHEPRSALVSGPTGLEAVEEVVAGARAWLAPGGVVVCEIGATQGSAASDLARAAGLAGVRIERDLTGRDRVLVGWVA